MEVPLTEVRLEVLQSLKEVPLTAEVHREVPLRVDRYFHYVVHSFHSLGVSWKEVHPEVLVVFHPVVSSFLDRVDHLAVLRLVDPSYVVVLEVPWTFETFVDLILKEDLPSYSDLQNYYL